MKLIPSLSIAAILLASACRGRDEAPIGEPVAECLEYEQAVANCYHRTDIPIAHQASLTPHSREDRKRIAALCRQNLDRFKLACR